MSRVAETPTWLTATGGGFQISATEITVGQFRGCVQAGKCDSKHFDTACNFSKLGRESHPMNCVQYYAAEAYCSFAGGSVCTEKQWLSACSGPDARPFPYGNSFDLNACHMSSSSETVEGRARDTVPTGSYATCQGGLKGLFDMSGNVSEWVDKCQGDYCKFRGGSFINNAPVERFTGCSGVCAGNKKHFQSGNVGIRCCRPTR